jgi:hypothetical protein
VTYGLTIGATRLRRPLQLAGGAAGRVVVVTAGLLAGTGWLYVLRGLHWFRVGPRVSDSLPLLQLAAADGQPLLRVLVAWLLAGLLAGVALVQTPPRRRAASALVIGLIVLLIDSQASYALARNVNFGDIALSHAPGTGPVLEAMAFALGCWLPRPSHRRERMGGRRRSLVSLLSGFDDRVLRGREDGQAGQHDGDRHQVSDGRAGSGA